MEFPNHKQYKPTVNLADIVPIGSAARKPGWANVWHMLGKEHKVFLTRSVDYKLLETVYRSHGAHLRYTY